jgi:diguanylate cyclase (GGDEF)-like protein
LIQDKKPTTEKSMQSIKHLLPIVLLLGFSFYVYQLHDNLPKSLSEALTYLYWMLIVAALGLAIHFNRSTVFFYTLLIGINFAAFKFGWTTLDLNYALVTGFLPILMLVFSLLPERGILNLRAVPAFAVLLLAFGFSVWAAIHNPPGLKEALTTDWLPPRYFDWTRMPQSVLASSLISSLGLLLLFAIRPSTHRSAALGILLLFFVQFHFQQNSGSLSVFSSSSLLMCLYAIIQESWRMAYLDELTELPGRRALREKFQSIGGLYTVAMLDVDHFKKFNDTYGHDIGDSVLRMIAAKMRTVSGSGLPYRYGGEEFTVFFNGKNANQAKEHLEGLRKAIADSPFVINRQDRRTDPKRSKTRVHKTVQVTVSIGVSDSSKPVNSPWDVMKLADKALYRAKKKGRNQVCS